MDFLKQFPERDVLLGTSHGKDMGAPLKVNNHIHTPYSFSAFSSMKEAVRLALGEEVKVLGINDFYVTDGYGEFIGECLDHRIFPLLNIELIGIGRQEQKDGVRINDPGNPGRIYICGKGLSHPTVLPVDQQRKLDRVVEESNRQVSNMIMLLNQWLMQQQVPVTLSSGEIMEGMAGKLLRERHVARALRLKLEDLARGDEEYYELIRQVYGGNPASRRREDVAGTEEELRARLLKSGAPAFVPEDGRAFLRIGEITSLITDAGGIPTYPMLLDGTGGAMTGFEDGKERLLSSLSKWGFHSVELIPQRNRIGVVQEYAQYFYTRGFLVSFGTEHNTSAMGPLTVRCKDGVPLDQNLLRISWNGAACMAAHHYMMAREGKGYVPGARTEMEKLGHAIFQHYFSQGNA